MSKFVKCDHVDCSKEARYYGHQHCYFVCPDHVKWGEAIEDAILEEQRRASE